MSLTAVLQVPELEERYRKVKKFFFLRESAYDVTSACQLRCDGCYYFAREVVTSVATQLTGARHIVGGLAQEEEFLDLPVALLQLRHLQDGGQAHTPRPALQPLGDGRD